MWFLRGLLWLVAVLAGIGCLAALTFAFGGSEGKLGALFVLVVLLFFGLPALALALVSGLGASILRTRERALENEQAGQPKGWVSRVGEVLVWLGLLYAVVSLGRVLWVLPWPAHFEHQSLAVWAMTPAILLSLVPGLLIAMFGYWLRGRGAAKAVN